MAEIDRLLQDVQDPELRSNLAREVARLRDVAEFGLVFERHLPEQVRLYGQKVQRGVSVVDLADADDQAVWLVLRVDGDMAELVNHASGVHARRRVEELVVTRRFGEPVYPGLRSLGRLEMGGDKPFHSVINAENYHALEMLTYACEGQVDAIYIDPPYNSGARDWKYNNDYIGAEDAWHHSKWLSFMERRLRLASRLLKPETGVLIATIDEHEVHHFGMLLRSLWPAHRNYMVTIVHNPKGTYKKNFARVDEYAFFVVPPSENDVIELAPAGCFAQVQTPRELEDLSRSGHEDLYLRRRGQESGYRSKRPNQFYAIYVDEKTKRVVGIGPSLRKDEPYDKTRDGDVAAVYPIDTNGQERVWRYERSTMQRYIDAGEIIVTGYSQRTGQGWVLNHRVPRKDYKRLKTVWWEKRHDAGAHGSDVLTAYLGEGGKFPFPKSVYAVRDCLAAVVANRPNALILDFFAGSGTTYHATCLLNAEDGGSRRSLLVTNNEVSYEDAKRLVSAGHMPGSYEYDQHGIFEQVTKPRVAAVTTGKHSDGSPVRGEHVWASRRPYSQGFEENVEFLSLDYLSHDSVAVGQSFSAIAPLLWLKAGAAGPRLDVESPPWWAPVDAKYGVLFDTASAGPFLAAVAGNPALEIAYVITDSDAVFQQVAADLPAGIVGVQLYSDYLRNFEINHGGLA